MVGDSRIHVARHSRLHALLCADVLDHQKGAQLLAVPVLLLGHQRQRRQVDRHFVVLHGERGVHADIGLHALLHHLDLVQDPRIGAGEELGCGPPRDILRLDPQNTQPGDIAGDDAAILVHGHDAVGHALQHALVVVLDVLHVVEQLGVFQADGELSGERFEPRFVLLCERASPLIQHLRDADDLARLVSDRNAKDGACEIARLLVERRIEAQIGVSVGDVHGLSGGEDSAGDPQMVGQANLAHFVAHCHAGEQLVLLFVIEEERGAIGTQHRRRFADDF